MQKDPFKGDESDLPLEIHSPQLLQEEWKCQVCQRMQAVIDCKFIQVLLNRTASVSWEQG